MALFLILLGLFFTIFSCFGMCALFKSSSKAKESLLWPSVAGKITFTEVHRNISSSGSGRGAAISYEPVVLYAYSVNDIDLSGNIISAFSVSSSYEKALKRILPYQNKSDVKVYYNPNKPLDALLEPGNTTGATASYLTCGLFIIVGIIMTVLGFRFFSPKNTSDNTVVLMLFIPFLIFALGIVIFLLWRQRINNRASVKNSTTNSTKARQ